MSIWCLSLDVLGSPNLVQPFMTTIPAGLDECRNCTDVAIPRLYSGLCVWIAGFMMVEGGLILGVTNPVTPAMCEDMIDDCSDLYWPGWCQSCKYVQKPSNHMPRGEYVSLEPTNHQKVFEQPLLTMNKLSYCICSN